MSTTQDTHPSPMATPRPGSGAMFDGIAARYDLLNTLMSFGLDRGWRRRTVAALELPRGGRVIDVATGTAAIALEIARRHPEARVVGLDPSPGMLEIGRTKVRDAGCSDRLELHQGAAEELPFEDDSFDGLTIAYGIRNVKDRDRSLAEMARVVRPGGRVAILEATEAAGNPFALGARFYVHHVVPRLGALLSGASEYRYLQSSIAAFPAPRDFAEQMEANGLEVTSIRSMTFGANTLFVATPRVARTHAGEARQ